MKTESVTYELVSTKIRAMVFAGEKITVKNVLARCGGSAAKISDFIKRYHSESRNEIYSSVSDDLLLAIIKEKNIAIDLAASNDKKQIKELEQLLSELKEVVAEDEAKILELSDTCERLRVVELGSLRLEQDLKAANAQKDSTLAEVATLKLQLLTADDALAEANAKIDALTFDLSAALSSKLQAEREIAVAVAKAEQAQEQLDVLFNRFNLK